MSHLGRAIPGGEVLEGPQVVLFWCFHLEVWMPLKQVMGVSRFRMEEAVRRRCIGTPQPPPGPSLFNSHFHPAPPGSTVY